MHVIKYFVGFFLIITSYSAVKGTINNYDAIVERSLEISHGFFVPLIIGFILIWPLFRNKSSNTLSNVLRLSIGLIIFGINLVLLYNLINWASYTISESDMNLINFYFYNANFAAWILILTARISGGYFLIAPFTRISKAMLKEFKEQPENFDISNNLKSILNDLKNDFKQLDFKSMLPNIDDKKSVSNKVNKFFSDISKDKNVAVPLTSENNDTDKFELIKKYKKLLDEEIITKEEFEQQKKKLLDL